MQDVAAGRRNVWNLLIATVLLLGTGCEPETSTDVEPAFTVLNGSEVASMSSHIDTGYALGFTDYDCVHNITIDADNDNYDDDCEQSLANAFDPQLRYELQDNVTREPVYGVRRKSGGDVAIIYLLAYHEDVGVITDHWGTIGEHSGDSEFVEVTVRDDGGVWKTGKVFMSAHFKVNYAGRDLDRSRTYTPTSPDGWHLEFANAYRGAPRVFASMYKHANYPNHIRCNDVYYDNCDYDTEWWDDILLEDNDPHNIGSVHDRLIDCTRSRDYPEYQGVECFWSPTISFNGWNTSQWGDFAMSYREVLGELGWLGPSWSESDPTVTMDGPFEVHPYSYCNWNANITGGTPPYTTRWYLYFDYTNVVETSNSYQSQIGTESFGLSVRVWDDHGHVDEDYRIVDVSSNHAYCTE